METIKKISVKNMVSKSGSSIPNQFIIETPEGTYFQSYKSVIAFKKGHQTYLDEQKWDYSKTTGKYRNIFLGEDKKETERKIKSMVYLLTNLN